MPNSYTKPVSANDIPSLDAAKITTGQFVDGRMPTTSNNATISAISTVANAALPRAGGTMTAPILFSGTHTQPSAASTGLWKEASGSLNAAVPTGAGFGVTVNNATTHLMNANGLQFYGTQTSAGGSVANIYRDSSGNINSNVATGSAHIARVNGSSLIQVDNTGIVLSGNHTPPANSAYGLWREALFAQTVLQGPDNGAATLYCPISGTPGTVIKAHGASDTNRPASLSLRSAGKLYANNGTWTNFYSLAEGTHNGSFFVYTSGYKSYFQFSITGTTLGLEYGGWGGFIGDVSGSPSSTQVGFRVSGGWIQINVGTSLASNLYFHAEFRGNVR